MAHARHQQQPVCNAVPAVDTKDARTAGQLVTGQLVCQDTFGSAP
jgi:hypothetical protein